MTTDTDALRPSPTAFADRVAALTSIADDLLANGRVEDAAARDIASAMTCLGRLYVAKVERDGAVFPPVERDALTATETATLVSELLRAADLNVFDLAMWFRRAG